MNFNNSINKYDPVSGLYFKSITKEEEDVSRSRFSKSLSKAKVLTCNIGIFDPETNEIKTIFPDDQEIELCNFIFEIGYDEESSVIEFNNDSQFIRNNNSIEKREPNHHLLIVTTHDNKYTLWKSDRKGDDLEETIIVPEKSNWHIDVKNSKIRVISSQKGILSVDSFVW